MLAEPQQQLRQARQVERERGRSVDHVLEGILDAFDQAFARAERHCHGCVYADQGQGLAAARPFELRREAKRRERREMRAATVAAIPKSGWIKHGDDGREYSHPSAPGLRVRRIGTDAWAWRREFAGDDWLGRLPTRGEAFTSGRQEVGVADAVR